MSDTTAKIELGVLIIITLVGLLLINVLGTMLTTHALEVQPPTTQGTPLKMGTNTGMQHTINANELQGE